jgi:2-methylcitrate dehydratase PrpD
VNYLTEKLADNGVDVGAESRSSDTHPSGVLDNRNETLRLNTVMANTLTRRSLMNRAGCAMAAGMLPFRSAWAQAGISPAMSTLSTYMSGAASRPLPDEVMESTKNHLLDTLAAMISGSQLPPGRAAMRFVQSYGGNKKATVMASAVQCGAIEAALVNGMLAHSDETDDSHSPSRSHPGCAVVPAAFAAAEQFGISGTHLLRAIALGYDVGTRLTMTLGGLDFQTKEHKSTYSFAGTFGASAAAGCAAGLSVQQMRWLLDYCSQQASGTAAWQRDTDHIEKAFVFAGMPARNGMTAALLVQSGWTGIDDCLSGADNFLQAFAPKANALGLVDKLGERYEITRTNIKKWTVGSPIQAPLDAMQILLKRHPFEIDQVSDVAVRVATTEASIVNEREIPDICLQHMIAVMMVDKTVTFASAHDKPRMSDPAILKARKKVRLIFDEQLESRLPRREAIVQIKFNDGSSESEHVDAVRGSAENPMPRNEVVAKARDLIAPVLGAESCERLIKKIVDLDQVKDIRELRPLLQRS